MGFWNKLEPSESNPCQLSFTLALLRSPRVGSPRPYTRISYFFWREGNVVITMGSLVGKVSNWVILRGSRCSNPTFKASYYGIWSCLRILHPTCACSYSNLILIWIWSRLQFKGYIYLNLNFYFKVASTFMPTDTFSSTDLRSNWLQIVWGLLCRRASTS